MKGSKLITVLVVLIVAFSFFALSAEGAEKGKKGDAISVTEGNKVKVHYTLTVEGKVLDDSRQREPLEFQVGSQQVIPGFENAIKGMKVGEKKTFQVSPEDGYGQEDPKAIQEVPKDKLPPDVKPEAGMTLYARGMSGHPIPVRIMEVKKDAVVLNFNHPLAGKTLNFDVEIIEISKGAEHPLQGNR